MRKATDEDILALLRQGKSQRQIARELGVARTTIQDRIRRLTHRGYAPEHDWTHTVPDGHMVKGTSTLYDADGNLRAQWVKSTIDQDRMRVLQEAAMDAFESRVPRVKPISAPKLKYADLLTAYPIGDPHFGMYAWDEEAGEDWDLDIAAAVHEEVMQMLVAEALPTHQAIIVNLGDALHYDGPFPITSHSKNLLDSDGRYSKMIGVAIASMRAMVDLALTKHERVHVVHVKGNHDEFSAAWLANIFRWGYEKEPRVTVERSPAMHVYHRFGRTLIGMHHGHSTKMDRLPGVMAADRPVDWGECLHRYWWTGHIHHDSVKEFPGVVVESFGTLAAKDEYAASGGWRSRRSMKRILIDKMKGEIARGMVVL